ncbi:serine/threonine protein kinase [Streptomyces geranii]|uniref:serine/threonine protein kinase n=1 Tax=Streptomyces geranii TaxID=2058923 RepID=UPI001E4E847D|nr:serine/threonine protein kinase [Streptomyces geranii]
MPPQHRSRNEAMAYAAAGMEPPPVVPLRRNDPRQAGPYRLEALLGSGGMGRVFLGRDTVGGTGLAAVKVVRPEYADDPMFRKRFEREIGALDRIQGAHIVRLLGSGADDDLVWVATEYIPGPTLAEVVAARGPIDPAAAWRLLADVGRAIEAIWQAGLVHRDLKPSNVILGADGARVIDFGVVQAPEGTAITATGQNVGTPAYMSPEQARGREVTAASDVFSLASTLTYAVTGQAPFGEGTGVDVLFGVAFEPPRDEVLDRVAAVDAELAAFIRTCLDKDPERRPAPETVFRTAIGHQLSGPSTPSAPPREHRPKPLPAQAQPQAPAPTPAPAPGTSAVSAPPVRRERRGSRGRATVLAVAAAVVLTAGGISLALLGQDDGSTSAATGTDADPNTTATPELMPPPSATGNPSTAASATPRSSPAPTPSRTKEQAAQQDPDQPSEQNSGALDLRSSACAAELVSGASGDCVEALQRLLGNHGLDVTIDGQLGQETVAAVQAFQAAAGTPADGRVGPETKKLLYGTALAPTRSGALTVTENLNARCLDGRSGQTVGVWTCAGTSTQKWALYRVPGQASTYLVVNRGSHRCLEADAATRFENGQKIHVRACDGLGAQQWRLGDAGEYAGQNLVSVPNGFCLDAEAATSEQEGRNVQGWACAGNGNQAWSWS